MALLGGLETLKIWLLQTELPGGLWDLARDFPVLVLFLTSLYYLMKWLDRMLEAQRVSLQQIYDKNQAILNTLLATIERKQDATDTHISELTKEIALIRGTVGELIKEIAILRGTVGEVAKIDDVIDRLMDQIRINDDRWKYETKNFERRNDG